MLRETQEEQTARLEKILHPEYKIETYTPKKIEFKYEQVPEMRLPWDEKIPEMPIKVELPELYKTFRI